jgi:hypothetical protein
MVPRRGIDAKLPPSSWAALERRCQSVLASYGGAPGLLGGGDSGLPTPAALAMPPPSMLPRRRGRHTALGLVGEAGPGRRERGRRSRSGDRGGVIRQRLPVSHAMLLNLARSTAGAAAAAAGAVAEDGEEQLRSEAAESCLRTVRRELRQHQRLSGGSEMRAEALPAIELYPRSYAALLRFAGVGTDPRTGAPLRTPLAVSLCGWGPGLWVAGKRGAG